MLDDMLPLANCLLAIISLSPGTYERESTAKHATARHSTAPHCTAGHGTALHRTALSCAAGLAKLS